MKKSGDIEYRIRILLIRTREKKYFRKNALSVASEANTSKKLEYER